MRGLPGEFSESQVLRLIENEKGRKTFNLRRKKCIKRCLQCPCVSSLKKQVNILKKVVFSHLHQNFYPMSSATCKVRGIKPQVHGEIPLPKIRNMTAELGTKCRSDASFVKLHIHLVPNSVHFPQKHHMKRESTQ